MTFSIHSNAEGWLYQERCLIERGEWIAPAQRKTERQAMVTLGKFAATWLSQRPLKHTTQVHYRRLVAHFPPLDDLPLESLTPQRVREWYATTLVTRPTLRSHVYGLLHALLATAVSDGLLTANPCQIERAMQVTRKRQPVILSIGELGHVADAIEPRYRALVLIGAWCGLRWGELIELRRRDIGAGAVLLTVERGATHNGGCRIGTPKSGKGRTVVVPPHIRRDILEHLELFVGEDKESLLFPPSRGGCHLRDTSFRPHFDKALQKIGRQGVRVHDLRHFAGTATARVGTLRETMSRLGHSTVGASLLYQGLVSGRDVEVAEALSALAENDEK
ncbi:site-specific integrase [Mycobacterium sp. E2733]|uniref:tyrosine-type recombinase/integrase n=1 Tax=Mycobacterium sp. E2733 TaxID=1834138 RepID=UPI001E4E8764|nr:site-specific integrase [Mycobacterium sp. E2733]